MLRPRCPMQVAMDGERLRVFAILHRRANAVWRMKADETTALMTCRNVLVESVCGVLSETVRQADLRSMNELNFEAGTVQPATARPRPSRCQRPRRVVKRAAFACLQQLVRYQKSGRSLPQRHAWRGMLQPAASLDKTKPSPSARLPSERPTLQISQSAAWVE
ncbi:hypothetical protein K458DRAFT_193469 [Lentithecium fluviatile CBS 122367]|uniref:Uncharacterized protein n=1 Tax=Lentithecium fluviatile CBS 122367 TaxID=1168545 RepID=A0A6G1IDK3_9PLEO|nr:hypothetical protein K458DRAFT_193469 [Lentithecium fluviatile CBS 122367]